ncbi:MAG: anhydro-N-acetylmuramic acid kinase [Robiginitomaculum sp.]|nr:anhydro-N-acetylmuramic acid kinase [Robiginitomaculum sp.]
MSGTSIDAMDAGLIQVQGGVAVGKFKGVSITWTTVQRQLLQQAAIEAIKWNFTGKQPEVFHAASKLIAEVGAKAVSQLLQANNLVQEDLHAIGFHGQTVLHRPPAVGLLGKTLQIGDAELLANTTGSKVVYDFRSADIENGGHGAPLAPAWHFELAKRRAKPPTVFLNIGGISNITFIPDLSGEKSQQQMLAFDCGPGNGPLDALVQHHGLGLMDKDGALAAAGVVDQTIVDRAVARLPKAAGVASFDRWEFDHKCVQGLELVDGAATLLEITVQAISRAIKALPTSPVEVLVSGGGRLNPVMMQRLAAALDCPVLPCEAAGFDGDMVEAEAFAWLASLKLSGQASSWPNTTGVLMPVSGGLICDTCD